MRFNVHSDRTRVHGQRRQPAGQHHFGQGDIGPKRRWAMENAKQGKTGIKWSGRGDLNSRPLAPQASALAGLRYAPNHKNIGDYLTFRMPDMLF